MKKTIFIVLLAAFIAGIAIQDVKIMRELKKLRKTRKETERHLKEAEELKEKVELEKTKNQLEKAKIKDPFTKELNQLIDVARKVSAAKTDEELDDVLDKAVKDGVIKEPYTGDFNEFMRNPNNRLDFS